MSPHDEITAWIAKVHTGDERAAQAIWETYFAELVTLARKKISTMPRRVADEEDIALSAMNSFFRGAKAGRFPQLADRHDLWRLLVTITARKSVALQRKHYRQKRGGGKVRGESVFLSPGDSQDGGIGRALGDSPTPQLVAQMVESCEQLLEQLGDDILRAIALKKMEGYTNDEIAEQLGCTTRTVERKLERIRGKWSEANAL